MLVAIPGSPGRGRRWRSACRASLPFSICLAIFSMLWKALVIGSKLFPRPSFSCLASIWTSPAASFSRPAWYSDRRLGALQDAAWRRQLRHRRAECQVHEVGPNRLVNLIVAMESVLTASRLDPHGDLHPRADDPDVPHASHVHAARRTGSPSFKLGWT